jgi:hypothetical protein
MPPVAGFYLYRAVKKNQTMKKLLILLILATACVTSRAQLTAEQKTIQKVFFDFLAFYKKNEKKFNSFRLYKGSGKDNEPRYRIQWKEAERYFAFLRKEVPYVGEAYIKAERLHFMQSDSSFREFPAEEIPIGFDYDRWAGGQESIEYTYGWYTSPKNKYVVTITGNTATLKIGSGSEEQNIFWGHRSFCKRERQMENG